ncbi:AEC family transporter [Schleiferilactobacillus harbinensis]|uniref:AEC family transporter n=1 Tax=Schleiferilactobacillus harbinensis TaxID=304207 RepID=UPI001AAED371|nr:AEC family transporter [Schleiferilactobacillus harbinensis]MBO3092363.1 AEC family transporter [Schleiferilactobacillus harbinensis]
MEIFWTSIQSVLAIMIMIAVGYFAQGKGWFDEKFSGALSKLIMQVALPASIFMSMMNHFKPEQLAKLSVGLLYSVVSITIGLLISWLVVRVLKVPKGKRGLMMTAMNFANTVFIGMPLNQALFGDSSIPYLLVYYIVNTVMLWTIGVWIIAADDPTVGADGTAKVKLDWHHLIPTPLWGFIVALPFIYIPWLRTHLLVNFVTLTLTDVGALVTPLSLIYIGIMLKSFGIGNMQFDRNVVITLLGRFVLAPVIMFVLIAAGVKAGLGMVPVFQKTLIIQAATPTFAVLPILATTYHGDVKFATNIVVSASVLFVVVVPIIMVLLG